MKAVLPELKSAVDAADYMICPAVLPAQRGRCVLSATKLACYVCSGGFAPAQAMVG